MFSLVYHIPIDGAVVCVFLMAFVFLGLLLPFFWRPRRWERDMRLEWALHVVPCVAMLYLMRKAGEPTSSSSSSTRALASAAEREEAGYDARNVTGDEKRGLAGGGGGAGGSGSGEGTDTAAVVGRDYGSGGGR